jgi:putative transposase
MKRKRFSVEQIVAILKVRQIKQLQEENGRLERLVAELTLDKTMLQDVLAKKL